MVSAVFHSSLDTTRVVEAANEPRSPRPAAAALAPAVVAVVPPKPAYDWRALAMKVMPPIAGIAILSGATWARSFGLFAGALNLISFPIGTPIGAYGLWALSWTPRSGVVV